MLYSYEACKETFGSDYQVKKAVMEGKLFQIEKGIYSEKEYISELQVIIFKYPKAVFTMNSAFYYHGMTDVIPDHYYLQTWRGSPKIKDSRVRQLFENSLDGELGKSEIVYNGTSIPIYDKERMFVELVRGKKKLPFDYYKEIINYYRNVVDQLDLQKIQEYAHALPKTNLIMETLRLEVL